VVPKGPFESIDEAMMVALNHHQQESKGREKRLGDPNGPKANVD
jgi:hypothetical protein